MRAGTLFSVILKLGNRLWVCCVALGKKTLQGAQEQVLALPAPCTVIAKPHKRPLIPALPITACQQCPQQRFLLAVFFFLPLSPCKLKCISVIMNSAFISRRSCLFINLPIRLHQLSETPFSGAQGIIKVTAGVTQLCTMQQMEMLLFIWFEAFCFLVKKWRLSFSAFL